MSYSKKFTEAVAVVLDHEGGFNHIKEDHGGATNYGISLRFLRDNHINIDDQPVIDWIDIKRLTREQAIEIYHDYFWKPIYEELPARVANKIFNIAVNTGHHKAHQVLQLACNEFVGISLVVDGDIGARTLAAVARAMSNEDALLLWIVIHQMENYANIVYKDFINNRNKYPVLNDIKFQAVFLRGWMNRARWVPGK